MLEDQLSAIWQNVLDRPSIQAGDNFFELGGDSAASLAVALMIEEQLDLWIDAALIYEHPCFGAFVEAVGQQQSSDVTLTI